MTARAGVTELERKVDEPRAGEYLPCFFEAAVEWVLDTCYPASLLVSVLEIMAKRIPI